MDEFEERQSGNHEFNRSPRSFQYLPPISNLRQQAQPQPQRQQSNLSSNNYDSDLPASPSFHKGRTQSQYYIPQQHHNPFNPHNKLLHEIKPRIEQILSDQVSQNHNIQKGLLQLKKIQERLEMDLSSSQQISNKDYKNGYLTEINKIIDELMAHSEQQSQQFRQSLHNLKNVNASILNEDIEEENSEQSVSEFGKSELVPDNRKHKDRQEQLSYHNFLDELSNIQSRLFNQIIALRKQKQEIFEQLNIERQRNNELERDYYLLQKEYNKLFEQFNRSNRSNNQYNRNTQRSNRHFQDSNHQIRHERNRSQSKRNGNNIPRSYNENLKNTIVDLESRLRQASQQKIQLQKAINNFMYPQTDSHTQKLIHDIEVLDHELAYSQRKAAKLFPYKLNSDRLMEQLEIVKAENNKLRNQTVFRSPSPKLQNYKIKINNEDQNGYQYTMRDNKDYYNYRQNQYQPRQNGQDREYQDRIQQYKEVLNTIRSITR